MEIWLTIGLGALLLLGGNALNGLAARRHAAMLDHQDKDALHLALELLQDLQKHRGLGAQHDAASLRQRAELAQRLDTLWQRWPAAAADLPPLAETWLGLRERSEDFNGHSQLIERLLEAIQTLELRLGERGQRTPGLGAACRALEDLARLRGLAVRAANHERCPLELQIQMRHLCRRLAAPTCENRVRDALKRLDRELIGASRVSVAPGDCFALLTPIIDERLQSLRLRLT